MERVPGESHDPPTPHDERHTGTGEAAAAPAEGEVAATDLAAAGPEVSITDREKSRAGATRKTWTRKTLSLRTPFFAKRSVLSGRQAVSERPAVSEEPRLSERPALSKRPSVSKRPVLLLTVSLVEALFLVSLTFSLLVASNHFPAAGRFLPFGSTLTRGSGPTGGGLNLPRFWGAEPGDPEGARGGTQEATRGATPQFGGVDLGALGNNIDGSGGLLGGAGGQATGEADGWTSTASGDERGPSDHDLGPFVSERPAGSREDMGVGESAVMTSQPGFRSTSLPPPGAPLLAIVIDDWGYGWQAAPDFLSFDRPLTVAILPHLPLSRAHAEEAHRRGHQVILHLPMEPLAPGWDLDEWAVTTTKASDQIRADVREALASVPHVSGVNNHMGSKATADPRVVSDVLRAVKEEGLFFLDSRTTADSVVAQVARELGVLFLENDRFIDPDTDPQRVKERILLAARLAKRRGYAVAIGHVRPETYKGLVASLPELDQEGVYLAYLSDVLKRVYPNAFVQGGWASEGEAPVDGAGREREEGGEYDEGWEREEDVAPEEIRTLPDDLPQQQEKPIPQPEEPLPPPGRASRQEPGLPPEPVPISKPGPAQQPIAQPEADPAEDSTQAEEPVPVQEPEPAQEPPLAEESLPAQEPPPVHQPAPIQQPTSAQESTLVPEYPQIEESTSAPEYPPIEEPTPAPEYSPVQEPAATQQASPVLEQPVSHQQPSSATPNEADGTEDGPDDSPAHELSALESAGGATV